MKTVTMFELCQRNNEPEAFKVIGFSNDIVTLEFVAHPGKTQKCSLASFLGGYHPAVDHDEVNAEDMPHKWVRDPSPTGSGVIPIFPCMVNPVPDWNGLIVPYFTREIVEWVHQALVMSADDRNSNLDWFNPFNNLDKDFEFAVFYNYNGHCVEMLHKKAHPECGPVFTYEGHKFDCVDLSSMACKTSAVSLLPVTNKATAESAYKLMQNMEQSAAELRNELLQWAWDEHQRDLSDISSIGLVDLVSNIKDSWKLSYMDFLYLDSLRHRIELWFS